MSVETKEESATGSTDKPCNCRFHA
jgi:hypothetical protein